MIEVFDAYAGKRNILSTRACHGLHIQLLASLSPSLPVFSVTQPENSILSTLQIPFSSRNSHSFTLYIPYHPVFD